MPIIFLNGCTSSGKTSICRELQSQLPTPYLRLGIDDAFAMLPPQLHNNPDGFFFDTDQRGDVRLNYGSVGWNMLKAHARVARTIVHQGLDLILDEVLIDDDIKCDWAAVLADTDVFMVGVHCALPELERRERERGDRLIGQARGQFKRVHTGMRYDLEIDTTQTLPLESAAKIVSALTDRPAEGMKSFASR